MEEKSDNMNVVGAIKDLWLIQNAVGFVSIIEMAHNCLIPRTHFQKSAATQQHQKLQQITPII